MYVCFAFSNGCAHECFVLFEQQMFAGPKRVLQFKMFASAKNICLCERCYLCYVCWMMDDYIVLKCSDVRFVWWKTAFWWKMGGIQVF